MGSCWAPRPSLPGAITMVRAHWMSPPLQPRICRPKSYTPNPCSESCHQSELRSVPCVPQFSGFVPYITCNSQTTVSAESAIQIARTEAIMPSISGGETFEFCTCQGRNRITNSRIFSPLFILVRQWLRDHELSNGCIAINSLLLVCLTNLAEIRREYDNTSRTRFGAPPMALHQRHRCQQSLIFANSGRLNRQPRSRLFDAGPTQARQMPLSMYFALCSPGRDTNGLAVQSAVDNLKGGLRTENVSSPFRTSWNAPRSIMCGFASCSNGLQ